MLPLSRREELDLNLLTMLKKNISTLYVKYIKDDEIKNMPIFYIGGSQSLPPPLTPEEEQEELNQQHHIPRSLKRPRAYPFLIVRRDPEDWRNPISDCRGNELALVACRLRRSHRLLHSLANHFESLCQSSRIRHFQNGCLSYRLFRTFL